MFNLSAVPVPDLSGKTILVTGAGRGIGAVLTGILLAKGATVYAGVQKAAQPDWQAHLEGAHVFDLDVTVPASIASAIACLPGKLDVLVNNAGTIGPIGHFGSIDSDALAHTLDVNVIGVHRMITAALPLLATSQGTIVNAGTGAATTAMEGWTAYCSSKAAARMLTLMCEKELATRNVQSFFIGIPPTDTSMQGKIRASGLNPISQIAQDSLVDPVVPASVMAWLCGPQARSLNTCLLDVRDAFFQDMAGPSSSNS
ncbi:MAG: SDR family oxidoreductase [Rhodobacteraceae bacterium]|nr:SDR family oxidoreductase [Paracoccaceae bacterium]PHR54556.1 MAG: short-chain dehydrogenase [Robiginitomaculum sp.]